MFDRLLHRKPGHHKKFARVYSRSRLTRAWAKVYYHAWEFSDRRKVATIISSLVIVTGLTGLMVYLGNPVNAGTSVIISGGITETEAQFGGLQRKIVYVSSNWYAFYNDGSDILYKKSSDGVTWGSAVDVDATDADNYNPSIAVSNNIIHVFWVDDGAEVIEGKRINTASADAQGTLCQSASQGTIGSTSAPTVTANSDTIATVAYSDTSSDTEIDAFYIIGLDGSCTVTDAHQGAITFGTAGAGFTAGDRPQVLALNSNDVMAIFQDGNLSSSRYDSSRNEWRRNNQTIAADTDDTYSATTDGTNVWLLSKSGTTATNFYHYPKANTGLTESSPIDSDIGSSGDEQDTEMDISCPTADNCKIVYVDNLETAGPDMTFVDCNDEACSSPTITVLDTDVGSATVAASPALFCVTSDNCKVAYGDTLGGNSPDLVFVDCLNEACTGSTPTILDADLGGNTSKPNPAIYCLSDTDCQVTYFEESLDDLFIVDCSNATCSTQNTLAAIKLNINTTNNNARSSIWCPASGDCKIVYHDAVNGDLILYDCSSSTCAAGTTTTIDNDVGTTAVNVPNAIDCTGGATECRVLYSDGSQTETNFVDCNASAACASATITKIDDTSGGLVSFGLDMDCSNGISDCKGVFVGHTTGGSEDQYFFDCDNDACSAGSVSNLDDPPTRAALDCPASTNCKISYTELSGSTPILSFADCTNEDCLPEWESLTTPFTGATNLSSVSLTYNSGTNELTAVAIKDTTEQVYSKSTNASSISWSSEVAFGFTAGDIGHISTPQAISQETQFGVVVRQGSNFEFGNALWDTLTQRAGVIQNDQNGTNLTSHTAKIGEKLVVKIQIDTNAGSGSQSKRFQLQYDKNDNSWVDIRANANDIRPASTSVIGRSETTGTGDVGACTGGTSAKQSYFFEESGTSNGITLTGASCHELCIGGGFG